MQVDAAYMAVKAVFDTVDHEILLATRKLLGVSLVQAVDWFRSNLVSRSAQVKIGTSESETFSINSGVPKSSNLGLLIFSNFINDILLLLSPGVRIFYADDSKI